jgi:hypothetical protein
MTRVLVVILIIFAYILGDLRATYREERECIRQILEYKRIIMSYNTSIGKLDDFYAEQCSEEIVKILEKVKRPIRVRNSTKNIGGD